MFKNPFSFKGRITRTEYGLSLVISFVFVIIGFVIISFSNFPLAFVLSLPAIILFHWFNFAQAAKRCHDAGFSGFLQLIPYFGFVLIFIPGNNFDNQYGSNPKNEIKDSKGSRFQELFNKKVFTFRLFSETLVMALGVLFFLVFSYLFLYRYRFEAIFTITSFIIIIAGYYIGLLLINRNRDKNYLLIHRVLFAVFLVLFGSAFLFIFTEIFLLSKEILLHIWVVINVFIITYLSVKRYLRLPENEKKPLISWKICQLFSVIFIGLLLFVGFNKPKFSEENIIVWSSTEPLIWENFTNTLFIRGGFYASIKSDICIPKNIPDDKWLVYAYMVPAESEKIIENEESRDPQVLIHEQYHFNITEYTARLLRKDLVKIGKENITSKTIDSLYNKYITINNQLQIEYDGNTNHNVEVQQQRYWELKIDDMLRQTAYYENPDMYSYYEFSKPSTDFYKNIFLTTDSQIYTSFPITEEESRFGEVYEVKIEDSITTIAFYKNGVLFNGGRYETAIMRIINGKQSVEFHYFDTDSLYNKSLEYSIAKHLVDKEGNIRIRYFDKNQKRVYNKGVYEVLRKRISKKEYMSSYFDEQGVNTKNEDGVYIQKRVLDDYYRVVEYSFYDLNNQPVRDNEMVHKYTYQLDKNHLITQYSKYDTDNKLAIYLSNYNTLYESDERSNMAKVRLLDADGNPTNDDSGISIYEYYYNLNDQSTSVKRYNSSGQPTWGKEEFFCYITDYDAQGRIIQEAKYYPEYVLKFNEEHGYGAIRYEYTDEQNVLKHYVNAYGYYYSDSNNVEIVHQKYDDKKNVVEEIYLDEFKNFAITNDGVSIAKYNYDERNNLIEIKYYDSLNNLTPYEHDIATIKREYDEKNRLQKLSFYNSDMEYSTQDQNVAYCEYRRDKSGRYIEVLNYNKDGKPQLYNGFFRTITFKNRFDKDSIVKYFDANNQPIKGISEYRYQYNNNGQMVSESYYDGNNRPVLNEKGIHKIITTYNERMYFVREQYFDIYNKPVNDMDGLGIYEVQYDKDNYLQYQLYYDKNKNPILYEGVHKKEFRRNEAGIIFRITNLDTIGNKIDGKDGIADIYMDLYPSGMVSKISYFNKDAEYVPDEDGFSEYEYHNYLNGLYYLIDREAGMEEPE